MKTTWKEFEKAKSYPPLRQNEQADVVVIGGGLSGIMSAYLLSQNGKKIIVLEQKSIGSGATEYTTAMITQVLDTDLPELVKMFGKELAKLAWEAGGKGIDLIEKIVETEKIDCEFMRCPAYIYASDENQILGLEEEHATAKKLGFTTKLKNDDTVNLRNFEYLELPNQAKFHPLKFLYALAGIAEKKGVKIFEQTEATEISSKDGITVSTKDAQIKTSDVIVATYKPFNKPHEVFAKKGMYKSYMLELELPKNLLAEALYWDKSNPYYYFRVDKGHAFDRMLFGGADHREELPISSAKSYAALEEHLHNILGSTEYRIIKKWTGLILEPSDGLALIGEYQPHQFLATGFSGNGMTYSAVSAMMFKDYVLGKKNVWSELFDPKRPLKASRLLLKGKDYIEEFLGGAVRNTFKFGEEAEN